DFFGNGAGWVPLLSLQANMAAFKNEVQFAGPLLYLSLYLKNQASQNQKNITALQDSMTSLSSDVTQTASTVNTALQALKGLQDQANLVVGQIKTVQTSIRQTETYLLQKAQSDFAVSNDKPFWEKALKVLSATAGEISKALP